MQPPAPVQAKPAKPTLHLHEVRGLGWGWLRRRQTSPSPYPLPHRGRGKRRGNSISYMDRTNLLSITWPH